MTNEPTTTETKKPRRWPWLAGIVAALLLGAGIGGAAADEPTVRQVGQGVAPEPAVTVTAEPVVETVTETVEVGAECRAYAEWVLDRVGRVLGDGDDP